MSGCEAVTEAGQACCVPGPNHAVHVAVIPGTPPRSVQWENEAYQAPRPRQTKGQREVEKAALRSRVVEHGRRAPTRHGDPETSHEAAASLGDVTVAQEEVLALLRSGGPMTDEQIAALAETSGCRQTPSGLRTRRAELVERGLVVHTGEHRLNVNRQRMRVWDAV